MRIIFLMFALVMTIGESMAGNLVSGATIVEVGSTNWNERVFTVKVSGGSGVCVNSVISFPENYSQSPIAYAQSHGMAMSAFLENKKVNIHNYDNKTFRNNDVCTGASSIVLTN